MIPNGSRFLLAATALAVALTVIYMSVEWGALGTTGLVFVATAFAFIAGINLWARDSNVSVNDPTAATDAPAAQRAPRPSIWPMCAAGGAVLLVVGLITYPVFFIFGVIALIVATAEWMIEAWSERASSDAEFNEEVRGRIAHPAEFPVLAALAAGVIVYSFSRIMLFTSKVGSALVFGIVAVLIGLIGVLIALRPQVKKSAVAAVSSIAVLGLVAGGVAAALAGERELHTHETTGHLAEEGECLTDEETHADNKASETVGAKANLAGEVILDADGTLSARMIGYPGEQDQLIITRANPSNVLFLNESDEPARLVLETVTTNESTGDDVEGADESGVEQLCTARIEAGGSQFLTFVLGVPTSDATQHRFVVPGVDGQALEVIVP